MNNVNMIYKKPYLENSDLNNLFGKTINYYLGETENNIEKISETYSRLEESNLLKQRDLISNIEKRVLFLGGNQISGSLSPFMHNLSSSLLSDSSKSFLYIVIPVDNKDNLKCAIVKEFVKYLESSETLVGANVTMPYKIDMYKYLNKKNVLDQSALLVGSVNTLYKDNGNIRGMNTDINGIKIPLIEKLGATISSINNCYILGAGGAARAAIGAALQLGILDIYVLNRSQNSLDEIENYFSKSLSGKQKIITQIYDVGLGDEIPIKSGIKDSIIINTLPFGFKKQLPQSPIDFGNLYQIYGEVKLYYELVYDAEKGDTPLVQKIQEYNRGLGKKDEILISRGTEMLITQAEEGFKLWSDGGEFQTHKIKEVLNGTINNV